MIFCWLVVAIIRDPGGGTLQSALPYVPAGLSYWAWLRMGRSGQGEAQAVLRGMSKKVLRSLPPPADGRLYLIGDTTLKSQRGRHQPLGLVTRQSESSPYTFGFGMVVLRASWDSLRIPVAIAPMAPQRQGPQHILVRQMLHDFEPPAWVRERVVGADAGYVANATLKLINDVPWTYVLAMPRTRKFPNGNYVRDMGHHLPKIRSRRRATSKPDGRRHDYWVFMRRAQLHQLGDVTIVLAKKRRNVGPKRVQIIVPNLLDASEGRILSHEAWRWGVELTLKEWKSGLHLGRMQVTNDVARVSRSVGLPGCASLVLLHLYSGKAGVPDASSQEGSLFRLKQRFTEDVMQDQVQRVEQKWRRKWKTSKKAA